MSASGVSVHLEKVKAMMSWERLKSVFEIRSFLGLAGYYRGQGYTVYCDASRAGLGCVLM